MTSGCSSTRISTIDTVLLSFVSLTAVHTAPELVAAPITPQLSTRLDLRLFLPTPLDDADMSNWFLYGPRGQVVKRGGSDGSDITSYGTAPPSSTVTKWRGVGSGPEIAGSTGGFIGLISGLAVVVLAGVFAGIYFYNRHRKRLPRQAKSKSGSRSHNPLPSLSFTRPSTDPYAEADAEADAEAEGGTPRAAGTGRFGFSRPGYARQRSYEWELPVDSPSMERDQWMDVGAGANMPQEPDEVALPLRRKSPRPLSPGAEPGHAGQYGSGGGETTPTKSSAYKGKGKERALPGYGSTTINPFDSPYDDTTSSATVPLSDMSEKHQSHPLSSRSNEQDAGYLRVDRGEGGEGADDDDRASSAGDESDGSIRVSDIRQGTRFVERFESKESLV